MSLTSLYFGKRGEGTDPQSDSGTASLKAISQCILNNPSDGFSAGLQYQDIRKQIIVNKFKLHTKRGLK
jgi:hypothetical protein